jgi:hypothetical protein
MEVFMAGGTSTPFGFRPLRHLAGGSPTRTAEYPIATGYATAIGQGDPVALISDGTITQCAAATRLLGVFVGVQYTDSNGDVQFDNRWPASTAATNIKASVIIDPLVTFEVESAKSTAPAQTDVGLLADHVAAVPSTVHGGSGAYISGTQGTGVAQWRVIGLVDKPYNTGGVYDTLEVVAVEHEFLPVFGGTPGV